MKTWIQSLILLIGAQSALGKGAPQTLLELSHVEPKASLKKSVLVLIDYQKEYTTGSLPLWRIQETVKNTVELIQLARKNNVPIIHVIHDGGTGVLFNLAKENGQMIEAIKPREGEPIIKKTFPNAFAGTELLQTLRRYPERDQLILAGLMTHMCIASTASAAVDEGYFTTVIANTTTTRELKGSGEETVSASMVKKVALATLRDRFSLILNNIQEIPE